ncbi:MAG: MerC domain-containing protein [Bacteroidetes bacterium]|nr:MerC domain-containing protein [Bacteroidota bacterium]
MSKFTSWNLDFVGFFASALCAIHCLALPFILTLGMLSGLEWLAHGVVEFVFIIISLVVATWSLGRSKPEHNSWRPIQIALVGFVFLIISRFVPGEGEHILTAIGGIFIASAHWVNWRILNKACKVPAGKLEEFQAKQVAA